MRLPLAIRPVLSKQSVCCGTRSLRPGTRKPLTSLALAIPGYQESLRESETETKKEREERETERGGVTERESEIDRENESARDAGREREIDGSPSS